MGVPQVSGNRRDGFIDSAGADSYNAGMEFLKLPVTDPIGIFAILLVVSILAPFLLKPLGIPGVVGLIFGGLLIGPEALGLIQQGAIPELLGKIGIIYIMFLAGLEIDLQQLLNRRGQTLGFGMLTFFVPLGVGFAGGMAFGMGLVPSLLLASMFSSFTLLTYPEVSRFGLARNKAVTVATGAIVITDVAALLVVAVIAAFTTGTMDHLYWFRLLGLITLYCVAVFVVVPFLGRRALKHLSTKDDVQFVVIFALMFIMSALAVPAGLEPVIGAFLTGIALNRLIPDTSILMNRLKFVGNSIFIPLFMVYVGLLLAPGNFIRDPAAWGFAAFISLAAVAAKATAAFISARSNRFSFAEGALMFGMTVNHAAVTLAVVLIGRRIGLFGDVVLTSTIIMILVTCVTGSLVTDRAARRVVKEENRNKEKDNHGTKRIMVSLSNPDTAANLAELASFLAQPGVTEAIYPAVVVQEGPQSEDRLAKAEALLAGAASRMALHNLSAYPVTGLDVNIASGLLRVSRARRANLVILGWNGNYNVGRSLFGSVLDLVVTTSPLRLAVAKLDGGLQGLRSLTIMVPPLAERLEDLEASLQHPVDLARSLSLKLRIIAQTSSLEGLEPWLKSARKKLHIETQGIPVWSGLVVLLQKITGPEDLLCLISVRKHQLAWQPSLEKLPKRLSELFPTARLLVVYPALPPEHQGGTVQEGTSSSPLGMLLGASSHHHPSEAGLQDRHMPFASVEGNGEDHGTKRYFTPRLQPPAPPGTPGTVNQQPGHAPAPPPLPPRPALDTGKLEMPSQVFAMESAGTVESGVRHMLSYRYEQHQIDSIIRLLEQTGGMQPVELKEGVILIHYHTDDLEEFWVGLGNYDPPLKIEGDTDSPVRLLCLLLSPTALGPEAHLKALSTLARWAVKG